MPELPDVETFKRYVDSTSLHQRIERVIVRNRRILRALSPNRLARSLAGRQFQMTSRHGKFLFIDLATVSRTGKRRAKTVSERPAVLVLHFGMTGFLSYFTAQSREPPHTRLRIDFADEAHHAFDCQRLFGEVALNGVPWLGDLMASLPAAPPDARGSRRLPHGFSGASHCPDGSYCSVAQFHCYRRSSARLTPSSIAGLLFGLSADPPRLVLVVLGRRQGVPGRGLQALVSHLGVEADRHSIV